MSIWKIVVFCTVSNKVFGFNFTLDILVLSLFSGFVCAYTFKSLVVITIIIIYSAVSCIICAKFAFYVYFPYPWVWAPVPTYVLMVPAYEAPALHSAAEADGSHNDPSPSIMEDPIIMDIVQGSSLAQCSWGSGLAQCSWGLCPAQCSWDLSPAHCSWGSSLAQCNWGSRLHTCYCRSLWCRPTSRCATLPKWLYMAKWSFIWITYLDHMHFYFI